MAADTDEPPERGRRAGDNQVQLGGLECPRCKKTFTVSYWSRDRLIQARCLSCDLKWPLPDVV